MGLSREGRSDEGKRQAWCLRAREGPGRRVLTRRQQSASLGSEGESFEAELSSCCHVVCGYPFKAVRREKGKINRIWQRESVREDKRKQELRQLKS